MVLNRAARLIFSVCPRERITPYLIDLHWLPIKARIEFKICLITYKLLSNKQPLYLLDLLKTYQNQSVINLRCSDDPFRLNEPHLNNQLSFGMRAFAYIAPRFYNQIPVAIKSLTCLDSFKSKLKSYLFLKSYDVDNKTVRVDYQIT